MDLYKLGGIFLDISLVTMAVVTIVKLIFVIKFTKKNGTRILTADQKKFIRKKTLPITIIGLIFVITSIILLFLY